MDRVITGANNVKIGPDDFDGLSREPEREFRRIVSQIIGAEADGFQALAGFEISVNTSTSISVTRGVAVGGSGYGGTPVEWGNVFGEGEASRPVSLQGLAHGTYGVWVYFRQPEGRTQNRVIWNGARSVEPVATRLVGDWNAVVELGAGSPGVGFYQIGQVVWDGSLVVDDITDARPLLFEGTRDESGPSVVYDLPDFSRDDDRGANGVQTLVQWVQAVGKRLEELSGRRWYVAPVYGENVRAASGEITVGTSADDTDSVHIVVDGTEAENRGTLLALLTNVQSVAEGDPRAALRFVPSAIGTRGRIDVDVAASSVLLSGGVGFERQILGPVEIRRTTGGNALLETAAGAGHRGRYQDIKLSAADGAGALLYVDNSAAEIVLDGCELDGSLSATLLNQLMEIAGSATVRLENCLFRADGAGGSECLRVSAAANVQLNGCRFYGAGGAGGVGIRIMAGAAGGRVRLTGCVFDGTETGILIDTGAEGVLDIEGCDFSSVTTAISSADGSYTAAQAADAGGVQASGQVAGSELVARGGRVHLDADRQSLRLVRSGDRLTLAEGLNDTAPVDSQIHAGQMVLGNDPASSMAVFTADVLPKAWGVLRWNGINTYKRSVKPDGGAITVDQIDATGALNNDTTNDHHIWRVRGIGLPNPVYSIQATVSQDGYSGFNAAGEAITPYWVQPVRIDDNEFWLVMGKILGGTHARFKGVDGSYVLSWSVNSIVEQVPTIL